jgi:hypothetical protein
MTRPNDFHDGTQSISLRDQIALQVLPIFAGDIVGATPDRLEAERMKACIKSYQWADTMLKARIQ